MRIFRLKLINVQCYILCVKYLGQWVIFEILKNKLIGLLKGFQEASGVFYQGVLKEFCGFKGCSLGFQEDSLGIHISS